MFDAQMVAAANFADHNDVLFCVTSLRDALYTVSASEPENLVHHARRGSRVKVPS
jgi:hypothetical protein